VDSYKVIKTKPLYILQDKEGNIHVTLKNMWIWKRKKDAEYHLNDFNVNEANMRVTEVRLVEAEDECISQNCLYDGLAEAVFEESPSRLPSDCKYNSKSWCLKPGTFRPMGCIGVNSCQDFMREPNDRNK